MLRRQAHGVDARPRASRGRRGKGRASGGYRAALSTFQGCRDYGPTKAEERRRSARTLPPSEASRAAILTSCSERACVRRSPRTRGPCVRNPGFARGSLDVAASRAPDAQRGQIDFRRRAGRTLDDGPATASKNLVICPGEPYPAHWQDRRTLADLSEHLGKGRHWRGVAKVAVVKSGQLVDAVDGQPIVIEPPAAKASDTRWRRAQRGAR